jgi:hypothetical protein
MMVPLRLLCWPILIFNSTVKSSYHPRRLFLQFFKHGERSRVISTLAISSTNQHAKEVKKDELTKASEQYNKMFSLSCYLSVTH